jgi:hypothetical protein
MMMTRRIACLPVAAAVLLAAQGLSARETAVARLVDVSGNVLVSNEVSTASTGENLRLAPGTRVLVTLNSKATIVYDDGCRVRLAAGERFDVREERPCAQPHAAPLRYAPLIAGRP